MRTGGLERTNIEKYKKKGEFVQIALLVILVGNINLYSFGSIPKG